MQGHWRQKLIASAAGLCLLASGCASIDVGAASNPDALFAKQDLTASKGLAARDLSAGECGLFVWTGSSKRFILFAQNGQQAVLAGENSELRLQPAVIPTGADAFGQYPAQIFKDDFDNLYTLKFDAPVTLDQGLRYASGTWRFNTQDGWDKVIPVYGLSTCIPSGGVGTDVPYSEEVMLDPAPYETKLKKLVRDLEREKTAPRMRALAYNNVSSPAQTSPVNSAPPVVLETAPVTQMAAIPDNPTPAANPVQSLPKIEVQPAVMTRTYPSTGEPSQSQREAPILPESSDVEAVAEIEMPAKIGALDIPVFEGTKVDDKPARYSVQIAALRTAKDAESVRDKVKTFGPEYADQDYHIVRADLGEKGVYYRLRVKGFESYKRAASFCWELKEKDQDCFALRRDRSSK